MTTIPPEAVEAATQAAKQALHKAQCEIFRSVGTCSIPFHFEDWAYAGEEAVAAALPHIEAAARADIGDALDARYKSERAAHGTEDQYRQGVLDGLDVAEQIARGGSDA